MSENTQLTVTKKQRFDDMMDRLAPKIKDVLPQYLTPERFTKLMMVEAAKEPKIYDCLIENPTSVIGVFMMAAELGLEVGAVRGFVYMIPRKMNQRMTLTAMVGYRGYCEMVRHSNEVVRLNAGVVYKDEMDGGFVTWTDEPPLFRKQGSVPPEGVTRLDKDIVLAYAVAQLKGGHMVIEVMQRSEIEKRRKKAQSQSFWGPWYAKMATKTAIRSLLSGGLVPLTAPMHAALDPKNIHDGSRIDSIPNVEVAPETKVIEADPIRDALEIEQREPDPDPEVDRLAVEIDEFESSLNEAGIAEAIKSAGFPAANESRSVEDLQKYRDELAKRVGGE